MRFDKGMAVRGISAVAAIAAVSFLAACGGSGGGGGGNLTSVSVGLSATSTTVAPGATSTITAFVSDSKGVTWALSGSGALSAQTATSVTYTAPSPVTSPSVVTITATSTSHTSVVAPIQIGLVPAVTIALSSVGPQTIDAAHQLSVNATVTGDAGQGVTWTLSPASGSGTLSATTTASTTYTAPGAVSGNVPVTLTATSILNSGSTASVEITAVPSGAGANVAAVSTDNGTTTPSTNTLFTSVTVCAPATSNCQTIDHILVDTGSEGLRLLQSALGSLVLPPFMDNTGDTLNNCVQFLDTSFLWGPVEQADIKIGNEATSATLIQVISDGNPIVPTACSNGGSVNENTPALLGANGILGIGLEPTDCTIAGFDECDGSTTSIAPVYYVCASSGCATTDGPTTVSQSQQVTNPVVEFGADSNGTAITLPALSGSAAIADGTLIFGIGTQANNAIPITATGFLTDNSDNFLTTLNGQPLSASFIDSGSNGLFFPSTITACTQSAGFYCPSTLQHLTATNQDSNTPIDSKVENFSIDNADNLFSSNTDSAFSTLGGPLPCTTTPCIFDWGLPFFYGKTVFTAIDGQSTPLFTTGPFWAY